MSVALIAHYRGPKLGIGQYLDRLLPPLVKELTNRQINVKILASPNAQQKTPALSLLNDIVQVVEPLAKIVFVKCNKLFQI